MPKIKSSAISPDRKKSSVNKKLGVRTIHPKKKVKSILVDVIEDETENPEPAWTESRQKPDHKKISHETLENLDSQKKFFSELVSEIKNKDPRSAREEKTVKAGDKKRSVGLYRRLVIKFIILVAILAAVVAYFSFSKLTIAIDLKGEAINDNLLLKVVASAAPQATSSLLALGDQGDPREEISGTIKETTTNVEKTYLATGETYLGEEIVGQVKIINNYNKSQALVATTRILSPDTKLFRLKNAVNVPAGGEVKVDIYAEKPTPDLAIAPTTFTIPGLWLGLQDKIYAQSEEKFNYSQKVKKYVNANDLERAAKDISDTLIKTAKEEASAGLTSDNWLYLTPESPTITIDAKAGSPKEEFIAKANGKIVAVSFSKDEAAKLAAAKLNLVIPDDKELAEFKPENIAYSLENYEAASGAATIKAVFTGTMILKSDAEVVNAQQLVNLTASQIETYLKAQPEIKSYHLTFSPAFIKKAPSLVDRIKVIVNK